MTPRVRQAFLTLEDTMNEESCSCESERTRRATEENLLKRRTREREKESWSAIRVISYGCLVETGATLVSINRRPISRHGRTTEWEGPSREIEKEARGGGLQIIIMAPVI